MAGDEDSRVKFERNQDNQLFSHGHFEAIGTAPGVDGRERFTASFSDGNERDTLLLNGITMRGGQTLQNLLTNGPYANLREVAQQVQTPPRDPTPTTHPGVPYA